MAERIISPRVRLLPVYGEEEAASDPVSRQDEESLASLAALGGVDLNNRAVTNYIARFSNAALAQIQGATQ